MNFHTHISLWDWYKTTPPVRSAPPSAASFYRSTIDWKQLTPLISQQCNERFCLEDLWFQGCRPYYKIFPWIVPSLLNVSIDSSVGSAKEVFSAIMFNPICLRFPVGAEFTSIIDGNSLSMGTILCAAGILTRNAEGLPANCLKVACQFRQPGELRDTPMWHDTCILTSMLGHIDKNVKIEELIEDVVKPGLHNDLLRRAIHLAVAISLLARDPAIIQPDVLADDRQRFDESTDPELRQRLIDKARKRGVVGWRIGERYETIPHYRRPHPALYHTGKGRHEQRIIFRAGAIVHRQKLTDVPTGHITPDGKEVEP